jgi:hypothetical protein
MDELIRQAPSTAAIIIVVVIFVRYLEKRDAIFEAFSTAIIKELKAIAIDLRAHAQETRDAVAEMHRAVYQDKSAEPE